MNNTSLSPTSEHHLGSYYPFGDLSSPTFVPKEIALHIFKITIVKAIQERDYKTLASLNLVNKDWKYCTQIAMNDMWKTLYFYPIDNFNLFSRSFLTISIPIAVPEEQNDGSLTPIETAPETESMEIEETATQEDSEYSDIEQQENITLELARLWKAECAEKTPALKRSVAVIRELQQLKEFNHPDELNAIFKAFVGLFDGPIITGLTEAEVEIVKTHPLIDLQRIYQQHLKKSYAENALLEPQLITAYGAIPFGTLRMMFGFARDREALLEQCTERVGRTEIFQSPNIPQAVGYLVLHHALESLPTVKNSVGEFVCTLTPEEKIAHLEHYFHKNVGCRIPLSLFSVILQGNDHELTKALFDYFLDDPSRSQSEVIECYFNYSSRFAEWEERFNYLTKISFIKVREDGVNTLKNSLERLIEVQRSYFLHELPPKVIRKALEEKPELLNIQHDSIIFFAGVMFCFDLPAVQEKIKEFKRSKNVSLDSEAFLLLAPFANQAHVKFIADLVLASLEKGKRYSWVEAAKVILYRKTIASLRPAIADAVFSSIYAAKRMTSSRLTKKPIPREKFGEIKSLMLLLNNSKIILFAEDLDRLIRTTNSNTHLLTTTFAKTTYTPLTADFLKTLHRRGAKFEPLEMIKASKPSLMRVEWLSFLMQNFSYTADELETLMPTLESLEGEINSRSIVKETASPEQKPWIEEEILLLIKAREYLKHQIAERRSFLSPQSSPKRKNVDISPFKTGYSSPKRSTPKSTPTHNQSRKRPSKCLRALDFSDFPPIFSDFPAIESESSSSSSSSSSALAEESMDYEHLWNHLLYSDSLESEFALNQTTTIESSEKAKNTNDERT